MKRYILPAISVLLVTAAFAQIEFKRDGGSGWNCVEVVDGADVLISLHATQHKAEECALNHQLSDPTKEFNAVAVGRIRFTISEAAALTIKAAPDETGKRSSDNPTGTGTVQSNCLTGFTCDDLGTTNTCNFDVPDGAGSDKLEINSNTGDGFCWAYKTLGSEDDIHIEMNVLAANANGDDFSGATAMIITDGIVWRTDAPVFKGFFPQVGQVRFRAEDAAGAATYSALGIAATVQPYWQGMEYDSATNTVSVWESSNGTEWCEVGVGQVQALTTSTGYGVASNNAGHANDYTATVDGLVVNNTLTFTEDVGCAGGGAPPDPGSNFTRTDHGYAGGPEYLIGTGQMGSNFVQPGVGDWESWMGTQMDMYVAWTAPEKVTTWTQFENGETGFHWTQAVKNLPVNTFIVHAYPVIPGSEGISNRQCANATLWQDIADGDYDAHYTAFAQNTKAFQEQNGRSHLNHAIRLGWEMNGNWYAWSICDQGTAFIAGWKKIVGLFRAVMPNLVIDFSPARGSLVTSGGNSSHLSAWAPDAADYDVISKSTHDGWYGGNTTVDQNSWEIYHLNNTNNNVVDLTDIDNQAETDDRWMALSEWATQFTDCNATTFRASQNQDFFIQKSADWLDSVKDRVAWAAYFSPGCTAMHTRQGDSAAILFKACFADGTC